MSMKERGHTKKKQLPTTPPVVLYQKVRRFPNPHGTPRGFYDGEKGDSNGAGVNEAPVELQSRPRPSRGATSNPWMVAVRKWIGRRTCTFVYGTGRDRVEIRRGMIFRRDLGVVPHWKTADTENSVAAVLLCLFCDFGGSPPHILMRLFVRTRKFYCTVSSFRLRDIKRFIYSGIKSVRGFSSQRLGYAEADGLAISGLIRNS